MNRSRSICLVVIIIVAIVGGVIRLLVAQQDWLWVDELHTAWATGGSFDDVKPRSIAGNQSQLYFWSVWAVRQMLGTSVLSMRTVSVIAGVLLIFAATHLAWQWTRSVLATLVVSWLIAFDPQFVFYATEARPYVLLQLFSVFQVFLFWSLLSRFHGTNNVEGGTPSDSWLGLGSMLSIVSAILFYCHSTGIWLFLAELIFLLGYFLLVGIKSPSSFRFGNAFVALIVLSLVTAAICLPGIWELLDVFEKRGNWALVSSATGLIEEIRWPLLWGIVLPTVCATIFYSQGQSAIDAKLFDVNPTERPVARLSFVLLWAIVPFACLLLLEYFHIAPIALSRYAIVGSVAIPLFGGLCVGLPGKWYGQLAIALILIGVSVYQNPFVRQVVAEKAILPMRFENWHDPIHEINQREDKKNHPVFLFANLIEDVYSFTTEDAHFHEFLQFPLNGIETLDQSNRSVIAGPTMSNQHFRPTDIELMKEQGGAWLIVRGDPGLVAAIAEDLRSLTARMAEIEREELSMNERAEVKTKSKKEENLSNKENNDNQDEEERENKEDSAIPFAVAPEIRFAQFPMSNVHLVSVDWIATEAIDKNN